jgi:hypothetical protein
MLLQVLMPIPTTFRHCLACEALSGDVVGNVARAEMVEEYPTEFLEEFDRLMRWINELTFRFGPALQVRVVDPNPRRGSGSACGTASADTRRFFCPAGARSSGGTGRHWKVPCGRWRKGGMQDAGRRVQDESCATPP